MEPFFGLGFIALACLGIAVDLELADNLGSLITLFNKHVDNPGQGKDEVEGGPELGSVS